MTITGFIALFLGNIKGAQLIFIILIVLLLFGSRKIPELMRSMGKGVHAFKQGIADAKEEINKPVETRTETDKSKAEGDNTDKPDSAE